MMIIPLDTQMGFATTEDYLVVRLASARCLTQ
jgi:hypothetical protein